MLKRIVFNNLVHFKDKTLIDFCSPERKDKDETRKKSSHLNIFVGANFCGKSTVLELIRRCMTKDINLTETNAFDENIIAYAFCEFTLDTCQVISGFIKEPKGNQTHEKPLKILFCKHSKDSYVRWMTQEDEVKTIKNETIEKHLLSLFNNSEGESNPITGILDELKSSKENLVENSEDLVSWKSIEDRYIATFPLRGIGIIQWTKSKKIGQTENYLKACERAEVISELLQDNEIDEEIEKEIFEFITHPHKFTFDRKPDKTIWITFNDDPSKEFKLLKASEGIIEAKTTSLLLAHKKYQTICLEDPDRGMHPQMIERLRTILYRKGCLKTILVVTHNPCLIDTLTIKNTHLFFRATKNVCSVINAGENENLFSVFDIEILRTLLFATKVLLVEGLSDREVVQSIFLQLSERQDENGTHLHDPEKKVFDFNTYQIVPIGGRDNAEKVRSFCKSVDLPCLCLLDIDRYIKFNKEKTRIVEYKQFPKQDEYDKFKGRLPDDFYEAEEFKTFSQDIESEYKTFVWKGDLEKAIRSGDEEKNRKINDILRCPPDQGLKKRLKYRLEYHEKIKFGSVLLEIDEMKRFENFLKRNS